MSASKPPPGTGRAGRRLWRGIVGPYELDPHEMELLRQAVRVADACEELQATLDAEGLMVEGRTHPAAVELRQQRVLLGRLIVAMRIPGDAVDGDQPDAPPRSQRRGPRGFYAVRGGAG
jgi:hypothetical protein